MLLLVTAPSSWGNVALGIQVSAAEKPRAKLLLRSQQGTGNPSRVEARRKSSLGLESGHHAEIEEKRSIGSDTAQRQLPGLQIHPARRPSGSEPRLESGRRVSTDTGDPEAEGLPLCGPLGLLASPHGEIRLKAHNVLCAQCCWAAPGWGL